MEDFPASHVTGPMFETNSGDLSILNPFQGTEVIAVCPAAMFSMV
jgi:hypothetical protein